MTSPTTTPVRDLYYRWEQEQWESTSIDLTVDARQWRAELPRELRHSIGSLIAPLEAGATHLTDHLVSLVDAALTEEHQVFLATQLVDNARHAVFFDLFRREVAGGTVGEPPASLTPGCDSLLIEALPAAMDSVHKDPSDLEALVAAVVLTHKVWEGMVALPAAEELIRLTRSADVLPGFRHGVTAVARDIARHVSFAELFLAEASEQEPHLAAAIEEQMQRFTPVARSALGLD